ncbi:MAG: hypothetical protein HY010_00735 [Acidobacteria bacterium]|nr:hypothetical protein [Acidobacteriota bacterium]
MAYVADLVNERGSVLYSGPAIVIEAVNPAESLKLGKSLSPDDTAELERLKLDGHKLRSGDRNHTLDPTLESCRATQLYRTVLHEIGHWVDFLEKVERPSTRADGNLENDAYAGLLNRYHSRPDAEKEHFAHRYAERLRKHLIAIGAIPFERVLDHDQSTRDGLSLREFLPNI